MVTSGAIGKIRSALARPLDRRYPTNLAVLILVPAAALALGVFTFRQTNSLPTALEGAVRGALTTFGGWALAREIAPDDNPGAFLSMGLALLGLLIVPHASVLPLFTAIMVARVLNRSVGIPATAVDSAAVTLLAGWTAYSTRNPGLLLVVATGFGLDGLLTPPRRRQWVFAGLCLAGGIVLRLGRPISPDPGEHHLPLIATIVAVALAYALIIGFTRRVRSVADNGSSLSVNRLRAAMLMVWLLGIQGALSGETGAAQTALIWAVLAGLTLMLVIRSPMRSVIPAIALSSLACAGAAQQSAGPVSSAVDSMIDVGGHRLHFRVWQRESNLTLVFEAGGGATLASWESVPAAAARDLALRVVAYDRAGMGSSEVGPLALTPEQEIEDLGEALHRLRAGRVILVGHSYGGLLSFLHALRHPERVAGMVLVDPMNTDFIQRVSLAWLQTTVPDISHPASPRDTVISRMKNTISDLVAAAAPAIAELEIPLVVVTAGVPWWGDPARDRDWRLSHETIAALKPNRRLMVATRSRHDIPATDPDRILEAVRVLLSLLPVEH